MKDLPAGMQVSVFKDFEKTFYIFNIIDRI